MSTLEKTLRWIVIAGVYALPFVCLVVADGRLFPYNLYFPYITGKNFTFRLIVEIIAGTWLALALVSPRYRPRRSWVLGAFALFVGIIALADALGAVPFKSFWSNYERMDGWVTLGHLLAYVIVAVSVLNTEKLWRWLFRVSLGVSVFASVYGFLQIAGELALGQHSAVGGLLARIDATFGNPIYLAVYLLFHIFLAALLWHWSWKERAPADRLPPSLLYGAAIVLDTLALFFTGTRGTMLGLVGGAVLALLLYALFGGGKRSRLFAVGSVIVVVLAATGLHAARDTAFVKSIGFLDRLASISFTDATISARFLNMGIAWQGVKERPILGWGQENYAIVFDKYYDPRMYGQEPWFDRVHNIVFDWWIAGGTLGLLAYLSVFGALLWVLWRASPGRGSTEASTANVRPSTARGSTEASTPNVRGGVFDRAERAILTGLLGGYFAHNLTVFDNVTSYILFASVLGYIAWRAAEGANRPRLVERELLPEASLPFVAVAAALLVWGAAWWVNAGALSQNRALIQAIQPQSGGISSNLSYFKKAASYGTYGTQEVREQLAQIATQVAGTPTVDIKTKQDFFQTAVSEMSLQEKASPLDARFPLFLGIVYGAFGDAKDAAAALERAHESSPRKQTILFAIAQLKQQQGDTAGALATYKETYELDTSVTEARIQYAAAAIAAVQDALANELLAPLIESGEAADTRIASAYSARNRYDKLVTIWTARIKARPDDVQAYFTLAAAYYEAGNKSGAIQVLQQAETVSPEVKDQAEQLIQQIQSGTAQVNH